MTIRNKRKIMILIIFLTIIEITFIYLSLNNILSKDLISPNNITFIKYIKHKLSYNL